VSLRSYYLLQDGVTITTDHPTVRYKSVARAGTKREAVRVFNSRFEKNPDGSYGDRKNNATTRRLTVRHPGSEAPKVPLSQTVAKAVAAAGRLGEFAEVLSDEQEAPLAASMGSVSQQPPHVIPQAVLHIGGVKLVVPKDSMITLTSRGEILVVSDPRDTFTENPVDLMFAGKVD
jgi:hypothetical protein